MDAGGHPVNIRQYAKTGEGGGVPFNTETSFDRGQNWPKGGGVPQKNQNTSFENSQNW